MWVQQLVASALVAWSLSSSSVNIADSEASQSIPRRVAILTGVSAYNRGGNPADGFGPLSTGPDLVNLKTVLRDSYRFQEFHEFFDEKATQANIVRAIQTEFIAKAKPGDTYVFYFTGHGHQVLNVPNNDPEPDGRDEVMVCWLPENKKNASQKERQDLIYLRDDTLSLLLRELTVAMTDQASGQIKGSVTVILDSCHSGSATKGSAEPKGRPWNDKVDGRLPTSFDAGSDAKGSGWGASEEVPKGVVVLSGSESGQYSFMMPKPTDGSALTYFLTKALRAEATEGRRSLTYRDIFERVNVWVLGSRPDQNPQLEGDADLLLFGDGTVKPSEPYARVAQIVAGPPVKLIIASGAIAGVTLNSEFEMFAAGSDPSDATKRLGKAKVTALGPFSCEATVIAETTTPTHSEFLAARAFLKGYAPPVTRLDVFVPKAGKIRDLISKHAFVNTTGITDRNFALKVEEKGDKIRLQRSTGAIRELPTADESQLSAKLISEWRWAELSRLSSPPSAGKVELGIVYVDSTTRLAIGDIVPADKLLPAKMTKGGTLSLAPGETAYLVCRNLSGEPRFVSILYLTAEGSVEKWPGRRSVFGQQAISAEPVWRSLVRITANSEGPFGTELFKLIATRRQVDLTGLSDPKALRTPPKGDPSNLQDLLFGLMDGDPKNVTFGEEDGAETWSVSELALATISKR